MLGCNNMAAMYIEHNILTSGKVLLTHIYMASIREMVTLIRQGCGCTSSHCKCCTLPTTSNTPSTEVAYRVEVDPTMMMNLKEKLCEVFGGYTEPDDHNSDHNSNV